MDEVIPSRNQPPTEHKGGETKPPPSGRVFLSYTRDDLERHARVVHDEATFRGYEVVDFAFWSAAPKPSVDECMSRIAGCDALIVLSARRLGWVPTRADGGDGRRSITWLETRHARACGIPVLPLLLDDDDFAATDLPERARCNDCEKLQAADKVWARLTEFRAELKKSPVGFFKVAPESIGELVGTALDSIDGRRVDQGKLFSRWLRLLAPCAATIALSTCWLTHARKAIPGFMGQPVPSLPAWLVRPLSLGVILTLAAVMVTWVLLEDRGRPQLRYRVFPLTGLGNGLLASCITLAAVAVWLALTADLSTDPQLELLLAHYAEGQRLPGAELDAQRWRGALFEADTTTLRDYVLPVSAGRDALSNSQSLAAVRNDYAALRAPPASSDARVQLLSDIARFHVLATTESGGKALMHFSDHVRVALARVSPLWRAEALYWLAAWSDFWGFTNKLEDLDRTGTPNEDIDTLLGHFDAARSALPLAATGKPYWVQCATLKTRAAVLTTYCGRNKEGKCEGVIPALEQAIECYRRRDDLAGIRRAKVNLGLLLFHTGEQPVRAYQLLRAEYDEAGDVRSGIQALALETLSATSMVAGGQGISPQVLRAKVDDVKDNEQRGQYTACLTLLAHTRLGDDVRDSVACRTAFACYLTDGLLAERRYCGIDDIDFDAATPLSGPVLSAAAPGVFVTSGKVAPDTSAASLLVGCDGNIEPTPTLKVRVAAPTWVRLQVVSSEDTVLVVLGQGASYCSDNAPTPRYPDSDDGGLRFRATGPFDVHVGTFYDDKVAPFKLGIALEK